MDYEAARFWLSVLSLVGTVAVAVYAWWQTRKRATQEAIDELSTRIDSNKERIANIEKDLSHAPGHGDINSLRGEMSSLRSELREVTGSLKGMTRAVDMVMEHLVNKGAKQ